MSLTVAMQTALDAPVVVLFTAVEILLPAATIRLVDGAGFVTFGGHTFNGRDATYGALGAVSGYEDGVDASAPTVTVNLLQTSNVGMAAMAAPAAQGSLVSVWQGCVTRATGAVVADPDLAFIGELDVATQRVGKGGRVLELAIVSVFERFFDADEGQRLNNGFHQQMWPGELGLEFVSQVQRQLPWGSDAPRPSLITSVPQTGGGAGGADLQRVLQHIL